MKLRWQGNRIVDHVGILKKEEQTPTQDDEAARCCRVLTDPHASEPQRLKALNTLHRLRYGS